MGASYDMRYTLGLDREQIHGHHIIEAKRYMVNAKLNFIENMEVKQR